MHTKRVKTICLRQVINEYSGSSSSDFVFKNQTCIQDLIKRLWRSSHPEVFCKKGDARNFVKSTEKHLCHSLFFGLRPATLLKKGLWHRCFPVNFVKFLRILLHIEHLWWLLLSMMLFFLRKQLTAENCWLFSKKALQTGVYGSSRLEMFCRKDDLRNSAKFTRKHLYQSLFLNKVGGLGLQLY